MKSITSILPVAVIALATISVMPAQAQQVSEFSVPTDTQTQVTASALTSEPITIAQGSDRYPEISATGKYSYIGVGANIGLSDEDQGVADTGFTVISKAALTKNISLRPSVIIGDDTTINVPITYDFPLRGRDPFVENPFTPYIGGGVAFDTGSNEDTDFLLTTGVDYRFAKNWVGNVSVNAGFAEDNTDIGVVFGVGYAFPHK
ncbi:Nucleoside-specific channel-forming protein, Tsx [[Leptolyngbya] sp. PCC 7376]|uniref:outer membrane beta-barrel protein n=1 Tax=[Leptolyngbya] sp. PCC 7376 TaxID=111781 RepID=UPI00029EF5E5|nr:outer membrane beta-barrel protein [[Leptolyngbya] sp. PCC 7376]AFY38983.1 Nucleoside-specific channel-forming protein, Tsx [[Leptolyngbya] sp. PCC 7376]